MKYINGFLWHLYYFLKLFEYSARLIEITTWYIIMFIGIIFIQTWFAAMWSTYGFGWIIFDPQKMCLKMPFTRCYIIVSLLSILDLEKD